MCVKQLYVLQIDKNDCINTRYSLLFALIGSDENALVAEKHRIGIKRHILQHAADNFNYFRKVNVCVR